MEAILMGFRGEYDIKELIGDKKDGGGAVEVKAGIVTDLGVLRRCDVGEYGSVLIAFDHPEFDGRKLINISI